MQKTVQQWLSTSLTDAKLHDPDFPTGNITVGLVRFEVETNTFKIYQGMEYRGTYDMNADRILSGGGFLDFLLQVHGKEWITGQHLKDLLDCVTLWTYREFGKLPQDFFEVIDGMNRGLDNTGSI